LTNAFGGRRTDVRKGQSHQDQIEHGEREKNPLSLHDRPSRVTR